MPALVVIEPGCASIQGLGFYGSQRYGIAPGGAMDRMALAQANALTGQSAGAAAIELGPLPSRFKVSDGEIRIAVSGADREVFVDGQAVPLNRSCLVAGGQVISIRGARNGRYSYLSAQGGMHGRDGSQIAGPGHSELTQNARSWILTSGDAIAMRPAMPGQIEKQLRLKGATPNPIRVVLGPQLDYFSQDALHGFLAERWTVSHASNRMAYTLEGGSIDFQKGFNIVSDGTVTGNIQIAGNGKPLVILRDRGTVGGYPKIATIITADIGRFSQTPASGRVTFEAVSIIEAQVLARDFAFALSNVKPSLETVAPYDPAMYALLGSNVAGDVFNPIDWLLADPSEGHARQRPQ